MRPTESIEVSIGRCYQLVASALLECGGRRGAISTDRTCRRHGRSSRTRSDAAKSRCRRLGRDRCPSARPVGVGAKHHRRAIQDFPAQRPRHDVGHLDETALHLFVERRAMRYRSGSESSTNPRDSWPDGSAVMVFSSRLFRLLLLITFCATCIPATLCGWIRESRRSYRRQVRAAPTGAIHAAAPRGRGADPIAPAATTGREWRCRRQRPRSATPASA